MKSIRVLLLGFFVAFTIKTHAQPAAVQQIQNTRLSQQQPLYQSLAADTNAPELYPGENRDVGPQEILQLIPEHLYFNILLDSQVFYTDNANFAPTAQKIGSAVFVNTFQAAFIPRDKILDNGKISSAFGIASQWYNYENKRVSSLDFDAQTIFMGGKYAFGKWLVALDASYTRIVNQSDYYLTYQEILPALTVQRFFPINKSLLFSIGNQIDYHFTDEPKVPGTYEQINNRFDHILAVSFTWQITPKLFFQPAYHFVYSNYRYNTQQTGSRNDYLNSLNLSLAYYFNRTLSVRTYFNYNVNSSDDANASKYHETNGGLGLSANFVF